MPREIKGDLIQETTDDPRAMELWVRVTTTLMRAQARKNAMLRAKEEEASHGLQDTPSDTYRDQ